MRRKGMILFMVTLLSSLLAACTKPNTLDENDDQSEETNEVVTEAAKEVENESNLYWPEGQVLPSFAKPVENLDAYNASGKSSIVLTMMVSLQGLINRNQPRMLVFTEGFRNEQWPEEMGLTYTLEDDEYKLIEKYKSEIKGMVVFDGLLPDTINIATTLAGLEDGIVVSIVLAETLSKEPYNLPIIKDFTGMFANKYEMYDYALSEVFPRCNKRLIIGLNPSYANGHSGHLRDLAVAAKAMVIWLNPIDAKHDERDYAAKDLYEKDMEYLKKFFDQCEAVDTYYIGWWPDEGIGIRESSKYGIPTIPADYFENMSVYAGLPKEFDVPTTPSKPKLENKFYLAFMLSDGDNAQYCEHYLKTDRKAWSNAKRGTVPITWTMSPALIDMAPQMLNYYYKTATDNDYIVSGPSGLGYTDPKRWSDKHLEKYAKLTDSYFRKSGFNFITVWNHLPSAKGEIYEKYIRSLVGFSVQERYSGQDRVEVFHNNLTLMTAIPRYDGDYGRIKNIIRGEIDKSKADRPNFWLSQFIAWDLGVSEVVSMAEALKEEYGDRIEFVRADQAIMLYNEYNNIPYNVSLRGSVTASGTDDNEGEISYSADQLVDGSFSRKHGWKASASGDQWVMVDLQEEYALSRYVIKNAGCAYYDQSLNTKDFEIQVSMDGVNFTTVDKVISNSDNIVDRSLETFRGRYVRVYITNPGEDQIARLQEIEFYGNKLK